MRTEVKNKSGANSSEVSSGEGEDGSNLDPGRWVCKLGDLPVEQQQ